MKQAALPLTRRQIARLRRLATEAGIPPPDPTRFSTEYRSSPADPEWSAVWGIARHLLGHHEGAR